VVADTFDKLEAGIWQGLRKPTGGADGNQCVLRVGEQEHRRLDRRDGGHQLVKFAHQGPLLGQEGPPRCTVPAAGLCPDLPVDMPTRGVLDKHRLPDVARVKQIEQGASVRAKPAG
jgi:hypothetical protein